MLEIDAHGDIRHTSGLEKYEIFFNGGYSTNYGLIISEYPSIPRINEDVETTYIEGRNGSLTIKKNTYKDRAIKMKFKMLDSEKFWIRLDYAERWITNIKDNKLFYDRVDQYYEVKRVIIGDISKELRLYGEFEVTFITEPFMKDRGVNSTSLENEFFLFNQGDFETNPIIKLYGNGNIQITINNETTQINNVQGEVTINSDLMICYDSEGRNKLLDMIGDFPSIKKERNNITVSSNVIKTNVQFTRCYR